jgi:hypothetical protein
MPFEVMASKRGHGSIEFKAPIQGRDKASQQNKSVKHLPQMIGTGSKQARPYHNYS